MGKMPGPPRTPDKFNAIEMLRTAFNSQGKLEVQISDQTSPPLFVKANQVTGQTTLAADTDMVSAPYTLEVASAALMGEGDYVGVFSTDTNRFYIGTILLLVGTTATMDTPLDSDFKVGDVFGFGTTNMAVDGSVTPQEFSIRGADPGVEVTVDLTRYVFTCLTTDPIDLTEFGDIVGGLTRGVVMRRVNGVTQNYVNFKTNIEMKGIMFDWESLDDSNPGQGLHGFAGRLTTAGTSKLGVATRLAPGEDLIFLIQDDLTQLLSFEVMDEGHAVVS